MKHLKKLNIILLILSLTTILLSGCNLNVMEMMNDNSDEMADTYVEWDSDSTPDKQVIHTGDEDVWAFDEDAFLQSTSEFKNKVFTTKQIVKDNTVFVAKNNKIQIEKLPKSSEYDNILLSLYSANSGKQGLERKTYERGESIQFSIDLDKIKKEHYFLEYYHTKKLSDSYSSSVYADYGIEIAVKKGSLVFVTQPTPDQVDAMVVENGDEDNFINYTSKDGRKMSIYVHGQMTYVYCKSEHSTLGVDYVRYQNESNTLLVEESENGVVCYNTSSLTDGLYYICIYENNGNKDSNQNYSSIVYEEEILKVRIINGYAAFLIPPDMESVAAKSSELNDKSRVFNTSYNEEFNVSFYIAGTSLYIYRIPDTYRFLQINLCDSKNNVVRRNLYSCTQRAVCYDTVGIDDGDYYIQLYRYDNNNMYVSEIAGCLSPKISIVNGRCRFAEPISYKTNMRMYNPNSKVVDKDLESEQNIECDDEYLARVASEVTSGCEDDYSKVLAVHDWIAEHIYYDNTLAASNDVEYRTYKASAKVVLKEQSGVCAGIANLMAAMLRSVNIPTRKINGYALESDDMHWEKGMYDGDGSNHSWNEVYVGDKWILVDTTWDMDNAIEDGVVTNSAGLHNHGFFDCTVEYFSMSHSYINLY